MKGLIKGALVALTVSLMSTGALAATAPTGYVQCFNPQPHDFALTNADACLQSGDGNLQGSDTDFFAGGALHGDDYDYIANSKVESASSWSLLEEGGAGMNSYKIFSFSIADDFWDSFTGELALGVKVGQNMDYDWAVWSIISGSTDFKVWVSPKQGAGLSHFQLYEKVAAVPVPAAIYLFGSVLVGLIGLRRRAN
jgi:hypothetical protein